MSFILDGLKKLEEDRKQDAVPDVLTVHKHRADGQKERPVWPYLILAALIINALLIAAWFKPWNAEETAPVRTALNNEAPVTVPEEVKAALPVDKSAETAVFHKAVEQVISETEVQITDTPGPEPLFSEPPFVKEAVPAKENTLKSSSGTADEAVKGHSSTSASSDDPLELSTLPLSVRQELPEISISAHIYSNKPSSRIVNINGHILREGGKINSGLLVDEITETGVILKYNGYRFRMRGL